MSLKDEINFSFDLLSLLHNDTTEESLIFSPKSILTGLAMIFSGAKDETAKQIQEIIGKGKNDQEILDFYSMLIKQHSNKNDGSIKVSLANQLFLSDKLNLLPKFCEIIKNNFHGKVEKMDFNKSHETSTKINNIIYQKTNAQISNITKPSDITPDLAILLINAMHFSAKWKDIFRPPKKCTFYSSDFCHREIDMIHRSVMEECQWNYIKTEECCVLGIPYENNEAWMYIVLPNEKNGLQKIMENLNFEKFFEWTKRCPNPFVIVRIPVMDISNEFQLKENLQQLGIKDAFENVCNLKGMIEQPSKLNKIFHKAVIKTNEYGTEASASTSIYDILCGGRTERFIAEHPFLFFITTNDPRDLKPLNILFVGTFC